MIKKHKLKKKERERQSFEESYRLLRTNLKYSFPAGKENKVILITSGEQGDGKSTVANNLSKMLSEFKQKTLIIDIDVRKPTQHKKFNISNLQGLTDILVGECSIDEGVNQIDDHLDLITAGRNASTSSELIASTHFEDLINKLKSDYEYIIIDSAPVNIVSDAINLLGFIDGVILVARYRKTKKRSLYNLCKKINQIECKILGVVFNAVELDSNSYYYYYQTQNNYYN